MSIPELEHYSKDQLIEELINRKTFAGVVIFYRGDAKAGRLDPGETVITKSPPLTRKGVDSLLQTGQSRVSAMFRDDGLAEKSDGFQIRDIATPLRVDEGNAVRVGKSRISLDLIVSQYENGMTPEDMIRAYDTLELADVYSVIAYYLQHRGEVQAYLDQRAAEAEALQIKIETANPPVSREELLSRLEAREKANAATGK